MRKKMTFEESVKRVNEIAGRLEDPDLPLEESLKLYEEGVGLIAFMEKSVEQAKLKIQRLTESEAE